MWVWYKFINDLVTIDRKKFLANYYCYNVNHKIYVLALTRFIKLIKICLQFLPKMISIL